MINLVKLVGCQHGLLVCGAFFMVNAGAGLRRHSSSRFIKMAVNTVVRVIPLFPQPRMFEGIFGRNFEILLENPSKIFFIYLE